MAHSEESHNINSSNSSINRHYKDKFAIICKKYLSVRNKELKRGNIAEPKQNNEFYEIFSRYYPMESIEHSLIKIGLIKSREILRVD